jgi:hypothetical protein
MPDATRFKRYGVPRRLISPGIRNRFNNLADDAIYFAIWLTDIRAPRFADWLRNRFNVVDDYRFAFVFRQLRREEYQQYRQCMNALRAEHRRQLARPFVWLYNQLKRRCA